MPESPLSNDGDIELRCSIGSLRVTIQGPADQATRLLQLITSPAARAASPGSSTGFEFVEPPQPSAEPAHLRSPPRTRSPGFSETRAEIEASFPPCPADHLVVARRLVGASLSGEARVKRAWLGGQWARAVAEQRAPSPNKLVGLDLRNRFYAVLFAEDLEKPTIFQSAHSYFRCVGDLRTSKAISHAFPSEQEARIYLLAAGATDFVVRP